MTNVAPLRAWLVLPCTLLCCEGAGSSADTYGSHIVGTRLAVVGHRLLVTDDGALLSWGASIYGARGVPDPIGVSATTPAELSIGGRASSVAVGTDHTCALLDDGRVQCWGRNDRGQLGLGDTENRGDEVGEMGAALPFVDLGDGVAAIAITCGGSYSCALLGTGGVKCWGNNAAGQLGQGDTEDRGDEPGEMGDALPVIDLGTSRSVVEIDAGYRHMCVLFDDGQVKCWGSSSSTYALGRSDLSNIGDEPGQMGAALPYVNLGTNAVVETITAGGYHTCVVLKGGGLKCWGQGSTTEPCESEPCEYPRPRYDGGRLGYGDLETRGADPQMGDNLPFVDLGRDASVVAVDAGFLHTCALLVGGGLKCWGAGEHNKLGLDINGDLGDEPGEMGDALPFVDLGTDRTVQMLGASVLVTCAVLDDGGVKCWGSSEYGNEMGDALPYIDLPSITAG